MSDKDVQARIVDDGIRNAKERKRGGQGKRGERGGGRSRTKKRTRE